MLVYKSDKLDMKNVSNSTFRTDIFRVFAKYDIPSDILGLIDSFQWNKSIVSNTNAHFFNVGLLQGSYLGQIL